jgi:amidase
MADALAALDATAQAELVRRGEATPAQLVDAAIARIERVNPELNAVIHPLYEKARAAARDPALPAGPFRGVPFLLKDLDSHSAGDPCHCGMKVLKELGWTEASDTFLVQKVRAAGFVIAGKTNTSELGNVPTTEPAAYGPTRNPWDPARGPGGSSGGSAAAVAAGLVPAAHASDGGGSIRIPASACGLVGMKPSRGRVSMGPDHGESWGGFTSLGAVTRSVRDAAAILDALAGPMPGDPYVAPPPARPFAQEVGAPVTRLRVGFTARSFGGAIPVHPDCAAAAESAAKLLASLGHAVEEAFPPACADGSTIGHATRVMSACTARALDQWGERIGRPLRPDDVEPLEWVVAEMGRKVSATEWLVAIDALHAYTRRVAAWWEGGFDLLLTPTLAEPPPLLGQFAATPQSPLQGWIRSAPFVCFTQPFNITGQPAISLPLHAAAGGLPIGVQLVAAYGREDLLFRVAAQLEAAQPWSGRRPRVHA